MRKGLARETKKLVRSIASRVYYKCFIISHHFKIMTPADTIRNIVKNQLSVSRFGDGEFKWIIGVKQESFQDDDSMLTNRLREILLSNSSTCLICIPGIISLSVNYTKKTKGYWYSFIMHYGRKINRFLSPKKIYGDALFTRWYRSYDYKDSDYQKYISNLKKIWDKRDIVVIEGELTRFGVGNDLLDNVKSLQRIIAPTKNAFSCYEEILKAAEKLCKGKLVLAALGPTATVLAYDLSKSGIQTIDIGHLDIEYEWYLGGFHELKTKIPGKYINEAGGIAEEMGDKVALRLYEKQIIKRIGLQR